MDFIITCVFVYISYFHVILLCAILSQNKFFVTQYTGYIYYVKLCCFYRMRKYLFSTRCRNNKNQFLRRIAPPKLFFHEMSIRRVAFRRTVVHRLFDIQPLIMYKGGRPHNSIWENVLHVTLHKIFNGFSFMSINWANIFQLWKYSHWSALSSRQQ